MLITLISIGILVIGIIGLILYLNVIDTPYFIKFMSMLFIACGGLATFIVLIIIIIIHGTAIPEMSQNQITYDGLIAQVKIINSEYEDVSKTQIITDVTEWNKRVYINKYWSENVWTNWFYDKDVVDAMEYIEL